MASGAAAIAADPPALPALNPHLLAPEPFEQQRRTQVEQQLALNNDLRHYGGLSSYWRAPVYSPSLDYIEGRLWSLPGSGWYDPWPLWDGYGYGPAYGYTAPWDRPLRQPTGHVMRWYGPNSYTYEPTYDLPQLLPQVPPVVVQPAPLDPAIEVIPPPAELREF